MGQCALVSGGAAPIKPRPSEDVPKDKHEENEESGGGDTVKDTNEQTSQNTFILKRLASNDSYVEDERSGEAIQSKESSKDNLMVVSSTPSQRSSLKKVEDAQTPNAESNPLVSLTPTPPSSLPIVDYSDMCAYAYGYHDPTDCTPPENEANEGKRGKVNENEENTISFFSDTLTPMDKYAIEQSLSGRKSPTRKRERELKSVLSEWDMESEQKDWNEEFIKLRLQKARTPGERKAHQRAQKDLTDKFDFFVYYCTYVLGLEESLNIPNENRKVKPLSHEEGGGIAGGKKFRCGNIWLKATVNDKGLYSCIMDAQKTANAELRANSSILGSQIRSLNTTLSCCVISDGHYITGTANVPVHGENTLVYGSGDASITLHIQDEGMNQTVVKLAERLNLKAHRVKARELVIRDTTHNDNHLSNERGGDEVSEGESYLYHSYDAQEKEEQEERQAEEEREKIATLHMAADVEGHVGEDGRFYIIDTARLFPPTVPGGCDMKKRSGSFMVDVFRPEFLQKYCSDSPLSSDAFSGFGRVDYQLHNTEVRRVFDEVFVKKAIPSAAEAILKTDFDSIEKKRYKGTMLRQFYQDGTHISNILHEYGVNVRYLGLVYRCLEEGGREKEREKSAQNEEEGEGEGEGEEKEERERRRIEEEAEREKKKVLIIEEMTMRVVKQHVRKALREIGMQVGVTKLAHHITSHPTFIAQTMRDIKEKFKFGRGKDEDEEEKEKEEEEVEEKEKEEEEERGREKEREKRKREREK